MPTTSTNSTKFDFSLTFQDYFSSPFTLFTQNELQEAIIRYNPQNIENINWSNGTLHWNSNLNSAIAFSKNI